MTTLEIILIIVMVALSPFTYFGLKLRIGAFIEDRKLQREYKKEKR